MYVREMSDGLYSPLTYLLYKVCCKYTSNVAGIVAPHVQRVQHALSSGWRHGRNDACCRSRKGQQWVTASCELLSLGADD